MDKFFEQGLRDGLEKTAMASFVLPALLSYYRGEDAPHNKKVGAAMGALLAGGIGKDAIPIKKNPFLKYFTRGPSHHMAWRVRPARAAIGALVGVGAAEFGRMAARGSGRRSRRGG